MSDPRRNRLKTYAGVLVSVLLAALAGWVLWRTFQRISFADVLVQMRAVPASKLALAGLCAAAALTVLAFYEVAVVRYVKHCIGRAKPMLTAYIAFPLGHAVGQAMLSGGALRYRMYTPAGFSATEVGATVLLATCRTRSASACCSIFRWWPRPRCSSRCSASQAGGCVCLASSACARTLATSC